MNNNTHTKLQVFWHLSMFHCNFLMDIFYAFVFSYYFFLKTLVALLILSNSLLKKLTGALRLFYLLKSTFGLNLEVFSFWSTNLKTYHFGPFNSFWRKLRKLRKVSATQIFAPQQLDATQALRRKKVQELLDHVNQCCNSREAIGIGRATFVTVLNNISNMFFFN